LCLIGGHEGPSRGESEASDSNQPHTDRLNLTRENLSVLSTEPSYLSAESSLGRWIAAPLEADPEALEVLRNDIIIRQAREKDEESPLLAPKSDGSAPSSHGSAGSWVSTTSSYGRRPRRGRKQYRRKTVTVAAVYTVHAKSESPRFWCTFCGTAFTRRYEWKRHEESSHVPQRLWVCPFAENHTSLEHCPCCNVARPTPEHLSIHSPHICEDQPIESRSYSRQDGLIQHILLCHSNGVRDTPGWRKQLGERARKELPTIPSDSKVLFCGFCGHRSVWWEDRMGHIGNHFEAGYDLTQWWLSRANNLRVADRTGNITLSLCRTILS
jgi:hypothetical protein